MTTAIESKVEAPASSDLIGSLAVLLAAAMWGTSGIFVKFVAADTGISALALAFWRDVTTFAVLLICLGLLRLFLPGHAWLPVRRADLRWLIALGASLGTFHVFWNLGVFLNGASVATVQQAAMPAIVAVVAWFIWRETLTWSKTYDPFTTLTYAFGFGALVLLPFQFFIPQPWPVPPSAFLWFTGLIVVSTIVSFSSYTFALGRLPASVASILAMSEIAFVTVYAYVLLDERLTTSQILGALLVVAGVLLLSWHRWRARNPRQSTEAQ
jgi:drug/metabolite transporter (DMT)-like permease